jgi:hypothetical protein
LRQRIQQNPQRRYAVAWLNSDYACKGTASTPRTRELILAGKYFSSGHEQNSLHFLFLQLQLAIVKA